LRSSARLTILEQLAPDGRGVEALAVRTGLTLADSPQHLPQVRQAGLVTGRRRGEAVICRLTDARTRGLMGLRPVVAERTLAAVALPPGVSVWPDEMSLDLPVDSNDR
jgi:DNA-binding transcriptional ArsR family regulator